MPAWRKGVMGLPANRPRNVCDECECADLEARLTRSEQARREERDWLETKVREAEEHLDAEAQLAHDHCARAIAAEAKVERLREALEEIADGTMAPWNEIAQAALTAPPEGPMKDA